MADVPLTDTDLQRRTRILLTATLVTSNLIGAAISGIELKGKSAPATLYAPVYAGLR